MPKIAIIYHTGNYTKKIADYISLGVQQVEVEVISLSTNEAMAQFSLLDEMDAIIFGSPTYFGTVSAEFKTFMDATSDIWVHQRWVNKIAAAFTCASNAAGDQLSTLMQLSVFAAQHGMIWVGCNLMPNYYQIAQQEGAYNKLGSWLGLSYRTVDEMGNPQIIQVEDEKAFQYFGKRIAQITKKFQ